MSTAHFAFFRGIGHDGLSSAEWESKIDPCIPAGHLENYVGRRAQSGVAELILRISS